MMLKGHEVILSTYHLPNSCEWTGVNGEALQPHPVYKKPYFLQVLRESVSVLQLKHTTSECNGSYYCHSTKLYRKKNFTSLLLSVLLLVLNTNNNTDDNKLGYFQYSFVLG